VRYGLSRPRPRQQMDEGESYLWRLIQATRLTLIVYYGIGILLIAPGSQSRSSRSWLQPRLSAGADDYWSIAPSIHSLELQTPSSG
jgi:hypothetical protein